MAVRVYYGVCSTDADIAAKQVYITDTDITDDEDFQFQVGDLLSVYFLNENTASNPSLVIYNGDSEQEISTIEGSGKYIKTKRIDIDSEGKQLWQAGDTLTFCYTRAELNMSLNFYWETLDYIVASNDRYGITMITGEENIPDLESWAETSDEDDYSTALAPGVLKQFLNEFYGKPTSSSDSEGSDEPVSVKAAVNLHWWQNPQTTEDLLGKLWVNGPDPQAEDFDIESIPQNAVQITFPIQQVIEAKVTDLFNRQTTLTRTSQLINDGPDPDKNNSEEKGKFYLTNVLPQYLYSNDGEAAICVKSDNGWTHFYNGVVIGGDNNRKNLDVNGRIQVDSWVAIDGIGRTSDQARLRVGSSWETMPTTIPMAISAYGHIVTHGGNINAGSGYIYTTGNVRGTHLLEMGEDKQYHYLSTIYAKRLRFKVYSVKHTIAKNDSTGNQRINCFKDNTGWAIKGIVGFNFNEQTGTTGAPSLCHLWECFPEKYNGYWTIRYAIRSYRNSSNAIEAFFYTIEEYTI